MRGGEPETLTAKELELTTEPIMRTRRPRLASAWV